MTRRASACSAVSSCISERPRCRMRLSSLTRTVRCYRRWAERRRSSERSTSVRIRTSITSDSERKITRRWGIARSRICLKQPDVFKTQLRALLRAAKYGNLAIMYPMIISVDEVLRIREIVAEVAAELKREQIPYAIPEQGIMIETPAAVMICGGAGRARRFLQHRHQRPHAVYTCDRSSRMRSWTSSIIHIMRRFFG